MWRLLAIVGTSVVVAALYRALRSIAPGMLDQHED